MRGIPDAESGKCDSHNKHRNREQQRQLVKNAPRIKRSIFPAKPFSVTKRQRMWNSFAQGQVFVHPKYHQVVEGKRREIENAAECQEKNLQAFCKPYHTAETTGHSFNAVSGFGFFAWGRGTSK